MKKIIIMVLLGLFAGTILGGCKADAPTPTECNRLDVYYD